MVSLQPDQINMTDAVCFWYLVRSDLSSVRYSSRIHWTSHFITRYRKHTAMYNWSLCYSLVL